MKCLRKIDDIIHDLNEVKKWQKFYYENHKEESKIPLGASGFTMISVVDPSYMQMKLESIKDEIYNELTKVLKSNKSVIAKLKKRI